MRTEFTRSEIEQLFELMETGNNIVRLVDPMCELVADSAGVPIPGASCTKVWNHTIRCENCSSLRALQTKSVVYKMEFSGDRTYWITSRFVNIEGRNAILEVVADTTDFTIIDSAQLDAVGEIIESYNHHLVTDSLTGVFNRAYLDQVFAPSMPFRYENKLPVNIALMDLDRFKLVNDTHGHQAGDLLLADVGGFWRRKYHSREKNREQLIIRYGGDEMIIVDCTTDGKTFERDVMETYEDMRKVCYLADGTELSFTMSFGFASADELEGPWEWDALFQLADERMYEAKQIRHAELDARA